MCKPTILIIDSSLDNVSTLLESLSAEYTVKTAVNSVLGLQIASTFKPDIILLALDMPDLDGYQLCRKIKADSKTKDIPVILITSDSEDFDESEGFDAGAIDFISEPLSSLTVYSRIRNYINLHSKTYSENLDQLNNYKEANEELQNAINKLTEKESQLKAISDSAKDAIIMMNPKGEVSFWNPEATLILGYEYEEAMGKHLHTLLAPKKYHPAYNPAYAGFLKTGEGNAVGKVVELEAIRKDGIIIPVELSLAGIKMEDGWHAVGIMRDISERKQYEENLIKAKEEAELLNIQNSKLLDELKATQSLANIAHWKIKLGVDEVIPSDEFKIMYGVVKRPFRFIDLLETIHADDREKTAKILTGVFESPYEGSTEYRIVVNGNTKHLSVNWTMDYDDKGKVTTFTGYSQDITKQKEAEKVIQDQKHELETIFNLVPIPVCYVNSDGDIYRRNASFTRLFGYDENEIPDLETWFPKTYPDELYRQEVIDLWTEYLQQARYNRGIIPSDTYRITCKDGIERFVMVGGQLYNDGYIVTFIDISEQRVAESEREHILQEYTQILSSVGDGIFGVDLNGNTTFVNTAAENILGWTENELIGEHNHTLLRHSFDDGTALPEEQCSVQQTIIQGIAHRVKHELFYNKNGHGIPVSYVSTPKVEGKDILGAVVVFRDITFEIQEKNSMVESQNILEEISAGKPLDHILNKITHFLEVASPQGLGSILLVDEEKHCLRLGAAPKLPDEYNSEIDGISYGEGIGSCGTAAATGEIVIVDDISNHPYWKSFRELTRLHGLMSCWSVPAKDENGHILATIAIYHKEPCQPSERELQQIKIGAQLVAVAISRDNHEKRLHLSRKKAETANQAKTEFLSNMSHEIRTPLNSVIGFSDLLKNDADLNNLQRQYIDNISNSAESLLSLINDILDFSKIEAGKLELENIETDIRKIAYDAVKVIRFSSSTKNIELLLDIQDDIPEVAITDPLRLKQILINLLNNSIKFTSEGEVELKIRFERVNEKIGNYKFSVRDTGIGIPKRNQNKLFNMFTQADSTTTRKFGGTGLGLAISYELSLKMGGGLKVISEEGQGSTFHFNIRTEYKEGNKPVYTEELTKVHKVLIADDNENNRVILKHIFDNNGIESVVCDSGINALKTLSRTDDFDVVILDYHMPGMDGIEVIKNIQEKYENIKSAILLYSSCDSPDVINFSNNSGTLTLLKPVTSEMLLNAMNEAISKRNTQTDRLNKAEEDIISDNRIKVLAAEDVPLNMVLLDKLLNKLLPNAQVVHATNGKEALEISKLQPFDIILSDIQMPEIDGLEFAKEFREFEQQHRQGEHVPIIALTAAAFKSELEKCRAAGMDDFATKPLTLAALRDKLKKYLKLEGVDPGDSTVKDNEASHFNLRPLLELFDDEKESMMDFIDDAVTDITKDLNKLQDAVNIKSFDQVASLSHKIKGSTGNMHFEILAEKLLNMEKECKSGRTNLSDMMSDIFKEWKTVKEIIKNNKL